MKVKFESILDGGILERERLHLSAKESLDIGRYIVIQGKNANKSGVSSEAQKTAYWFADKKIEAGDWVVLYTKDGTDRVKEREDGKKTYFYYWGHSEPLWVSGYTPVITELAGWMFGNRIE